MTITLKVLPYSNNHHKSGFSTFNHMLKQQQEEQQQLQTTSTNVCVLISIKFSATLLMCVNKHYNQNMQTFVYNNNNLLHLLKLMACHHNSLLFNLAHFTESCCWDVWLASMLSGNYTQYFYIKIDNYITLTAESLTLIAECNKKANL